MDRNEYFTVVFRGSIQALPSDPMRMKTEFGQAVACGSGDALTEVEGLIDDLTAASAGRAALTERARP